MNELEKVKKEIAKKIAFSHGYTFPTGDIELDDSFLWHADQVLKTDGVRIECEKQDLPNEQLKIILTDNMQTYEDKVIEIKGLFKEAGFVKYLPKEK
jgi:hypothetical protein